VVLKALQEERMVFMKYRRIYSELLKRAAAEIADIKLKLVYQFTSKKCGFDLGGLAFKRLGHFYGTRTLTG